MDYLEYKKYHESRMANHTGSSAIEIEAVLTTVSLGIFFRLWLEFYTHYLSNKFLTFILDFAFIALPVTLQVTLASSVPYLIPLTIYSLFFSVALRFGHLNNLKQILLQKVSQRRSYITNYRASTNLVSALCILAVDFRVFPRRYAKTETFGFGLMDLGVGYFICSNGIVTKNLISNMDLFKTIKSCGVLIFLGFTRLLSVKSVNYHEHASEYGVHWNFFFTLAFSRILSFFVLMGSPIKKPFFLALISGLIHQILLQNGLAEWVFSETPRDTFWAANREGLTSLLGYVSLYFASVSVAQTINNNETTYQGLLYQLLMLCFGMWGCTFVSYSTTGISRRLANVGYIFWIISSTLTVILQFVIIDITLSSINESRKKKLPPGTTQVPLLMDSINANGLFFFLFSNVMTGIINMSFQTLLLQSVSSFALICVYMILICGVPFILYQKKIICKFW